MTKTLIIAIDSQSLVSYATFIFLTNSVSSCISLKRSTLESDFDFSSLLVSSDTGTNLGSAPGKVGRKNGAFSGAFGGSFGLLRA